MADPRVEQYGKLLVNRCIDVQPGWQVVVIASALARPLVEEVVRAIGAREAYPIIQLSFGGMDHWPFDKIWAETAGRSCWRSALPCASRSRTNRCLDPDRRAREHEGRRRPATPSTRTHSPRRGHALTARRLALEIPWVTCRYPTPALAQDAGMTLKRSRTSSSAPCLLDWDAEGRKMQRISRPLRRARGGPDRRRTRPTSASARRPSGPGRRRAPKHAGRRGLLQPRRGFDRRRRHVLRVPRGAPARRRRRRPHALRGRPRRRGVGRPRTRRP